jgi:uncharacterized protein (TIGR02001 family)
MKKSILNLALVAAFGFAPVAAMAQEEASDDSSGFNWNAAVTSEYYFRGISQGVDRAALQLGAGYTFSSGFYVGAWGSNIEFGDSTDNEIDVFVGYNRDISDDWNWDVQVVRYDYTDQPDGVDYAYNELINKFSYGDHLAFTVGYTNDYLNSSESSMYYAANGTWEIGNGFNFSAGVGYTTVSGPLDNFIDYSVGIDRDIGVINASVKYIGTDDSAEDNFGPDLSDDKFVFTLSYTN